MRSFRIHSGLSIVELLIVIAIIGVLSAVLYPTLTGYFQGARDTDRMTSIGAIAKAMESYFTDRSQYPSAKSDGCLRDFDAKYMPITPKGPRADYNEGCGENGTFGYGVNADRTEYIVIARMERQKNGNYDNSGNIVLTGANLNNIATIAQSIREKSGQWYVQAGR